MNKGKARGALRGGRDTGLITELAVGRAFGELRYGLERFELNEKLLGMLAIGLGRRGGQGGERALSYPCQHNGPATIDERATLASIKDELPDDYVIRT